jgi:glucose/arabinose dehydrogenase
MTLKWHHLIAFVLIVLVGGCGQTTSDARSNQPSGDSGPIVIDAQTSPEGIKRRPKNAPIVGGRPIMPPQHRVTEPPVRRTTIAKNLRVPWDMEFTADGRLMFFTERPGQLHVVTLSDTEPTVRTVLNREEVLHWGEGGLMGMALHPQFESKGGNDNWIYLCETYGEYDSARNRIVRIDVGDNNFLKEMPSNQSITVEPLIDNMPAASYHDGCQLEFGPDGYLYATMGDAGNPDSAQDLSSWSGKILRMTPEGEPAPGNPFDGSGARPYVYSYGHRNPQGLSWHPENEQLYSSEHGPSGEFGLSGHDEINRIERGTNYGWPAVIGAPGLEDYRDPVLMFPHPHLPPAGAAFNQQFSKKNSSVSLFVGSLRGENLLRAQLSSNGEVQTIERWFEEDFFSGRLGRIRAVSTGPGGHLYIATSNRDGRGDPRPTDDRIIRLSPRKTTSR